MNGAKHYTEAEACLTLSVERFNAGHSLQADALMARAQVHASLALSAATLCAGEENLRWWRGSHMDDTNTASMDREAANE